MASVAHELRKDLEAQGEYVVTANISSGWFAVFQSTWRHRLEVATRNGREGPNLIVYRTRSGNPRDHHVIPYSVVGPLLTETTLTHSTVNGSDRWNLTLSDGELHVTHRPGSINVGPYLGNALLVEDPDVLLPEELTPGETFSEGAARQVLVNAYERDRVARHRCIEHYGRSCVVCGMSFAGAYGPTAAQIIHVHHVVALSTIKQEYKVNPVRDLRPVCPNCHAVIHSRRPPFSIDEALRLFRNRGPRP